MKLEHQTREEAIYGYMELHDIWSEREVILLMEEEKERLKEKYS